MERTAFPVLHDQLADRRQRLARAAVSRGRSDEVVRLLEEIDAALLRMDTGRFGLCLTCGDPIEADRLLADPLTRFCLDHLTAQEQRALEQDLDLAARIQRELLPKHDARLDGWDVAFHYQPAGPVSGDYCDLIRGPAGEAYFLVGDVAGKGVAAAMLMSHLSAVLRTLVPAGLPLPQLIERASRAFCESTLPTHYATLVCGRASTSSEVEICNAGHPPPLVLRAAGKVERVEATGLPVGMFSTGRFASTTVRLDPGETLLFYTDGVVEARDTAGEEYGIERLCGLAASAAALGAAPLVERCAGALAAFVAAPVRSDDVTMMAVRRST